MKYEHQRPDGASTTFETDPSVDQAVASFMVAARRTLYAGVVFVIGYALGVAGYVPV